MEHKHTYDINLHTISTKRFRENPLVLWNFDYGSPEAVVGRATKIDEDSVSIEFMDGVPRHDHHIAPSFWVNPDTLERELVVLAVVPANSKVTPRI